MRILFLEPFHTGSHAAFARTLTAGIDADWTLLTLPGRHWKWRMRGAAPWFAAQAAVAGPYDLVLATSYVNLAELVGLAPHLARIPRVLFFHENQFAYPDRTRGEFDLDFGWVQAVSARAATHLVFNSAWNRSSFLDGATAIFERLPDAVPTGWVDELRAKSSVLPIPLELPELATGDFDDEARDRSDGPVILWNHRWEHDKDPDTFAEALRTLRSRDVPFRLAICGERYTSAPPVFDALRTEFAERLVHFGHLPSRDDYVSLLRRAQIAVSTARQEFFGMALLEATWCGARPVAPRRLSYPELLPARFLHEQGALAATLEALCVDWTNGKGDLRQDRRELVAPYGAAAVLPRFDALLRAVVG